MIARTPRRLRPVQASVNTPVPVPAPETVPLITAVAAQANAAKQVVAEMEVAEAVRRVIM